jgi:hypothetical protein
MNATSRQGDTGLAPGRLHRFWPWKARIAQYLGVLAILLLVAGCGAWSRVKGPYTGVDYTVDLPSTGWFRLKGVDQLLLTREGLRLQSMQIMRLPVVGFLPHSQRSLDPDMTPLEASTTIADDLSFDASIGHFEVLESRPTMVGGRPGFRLVADYRDLQDLQYRMVYYGVLSGWWFYCLRYDAPLRHYYERDLAAFERMAGSFVFR